MNDICGSSILSVLSDFDPNELSLAYLVIPMSILVSCPCNTLIIPIQISWDYIRAHYQLDQQFGDNSFD
ncbi:hypothetical protein NC651_027621 [Populus alba x Populus x berolinensis]|nr:hypothetical protein NC651_027621 [Populus alba x Populus x berolinensis]